ncbi:MAG: ACT domain-containing protein [Candidatus Aenigmarchaeota archaeon]|nr:ACT domain-containing protein [Candidatus Aenigmarchaeota archaeon]
MRFDIAKMDRKGRVTIPSYIREGMGIEDGIELIISLDGKILKVIPIVAEKNAEIYVSMKDVPGMLSRIINALSKNSVDIIFSQSHTPERGKIAFFSAIVDIVNVKDIKKLKKDLHNIRGVFTVKIAEKRK